MTDMTTEKLYTEAEVIATVKSQSAILVASLQKATDENESLTSQLNDALASGDKARSDLEAANTLLQNIKDSFTSFHALVGTPLKKV